MKTPPAAGGEARPRTPACESGRGETGRVEKRTRENTTEDIKKNQGLFSALPKTDPDFFPSLDTCGVEDYLLLHPKVVHLAPRQGGDSHEPLTKIIHINNLNTNEAHMKTAIVRAKVEPELKIEAESILNTLGLSVSRAITLLLHQIVLTKGLPFDLYIPSKMVEDSIRASREERSSEEYMKTDDFIKSIEEKPCLAKSDLIKHTKRLTKNVKNQVTT